MKVHMIRNTVSRLPICLADSATARASPPAVRVPNPLLSPLLKVAPVSPKQNPFNISTYIVYRHQGQVP
jgi:hypothetical protein